MTFRQNKSLLNFDHLMWTIWAASFLGFIVFITGSVLNIVPIEAAQSGVRDVCGILTPPARYSHLKAGPKLGVDGPHYVNAQQVALQCKDSGYQDAVGCTTAILLGKTVIAYKVLIASNPPPGRYPRCSPAKWRASILKHEQAHMNGWGQNHPQ